MSVLEMISVVEVNAFRCVARRGFFLQVSKAKGIDMICCFYLMAYKWCEEYGVLLFISNDNI